MDSDDRIVKETGLDARIAAIVVPMISDLGFRLVRVRISGLNGMTVQIMVEKFDGTMGIHECEQVSKNISPVLDVEDAVKQSYHLEVSSPGVDRPLARLSDFQRWSGHEAKIELKVARDGRRRYRGTLLGSRDVDERLEIGLELGDVPVGSDSKVWLPADNIGEAKLVMTDRLMGEAQQLLHPS